jgi:hypothetical protein
MTNIKKIWVTPVEAKALLAHNGHNRNLSGALITKLRSDMNEGRWNEDTMELVKLASDMTLLDGQHRLEALSGAAVDGINLWVAYDVPKEAQEFMDLGKSRTIQDVLRLRHPDLQALPIVSAMCRWLAAMPRLGTGLNFNSAIKKSGVTVHEMLAVFESDPERIASCAMDAHRFSNVNKLLPPSIVGYLWYQMEMVDPGAGTEFFGAIKTLSFDTVEDPRQAVFEQCKRIRLDPKISNGAKETSSIYAAVITRGYNLWATGKKASQIRYRHVGGALMEPEAPVARTIKK